MRHSYGGGRDVGSFCHWCGEPVGCCTVRTGSHVFCRNGRRCQQAHARAFRKYQSRVTVGRISPADLVRPSKVDDNATKAKPAVSSSRMIVGSRLRGGNARKGGK